ncbi:hypothetical protein G9F72_011105 [Clostridium estertheticum]|uniref:hypothetical protein n=1 Tax=Clostridium estertheticum TaxID=238834 RepID=UPI0013E91A5A|nr:hypothetical protein [Clostridium estertheticum]MBZ9686873.1 hypothetical protein [Clostridium estertheticum]
MKKQTDIKGTIQYPTITTGKVTQILHKTGSTVIRTDIFVYTTNLVTETRTMASDGSTLVYKYHTDTLQTEVI